MPRGRPKSNGNPFVDLPSEWKVKADSSSIVELNAVLAEIAKSEEQMQLEKESDPDLASAKEEYEEAMAGYREAKRLNRLKTKYTLRVLAAREQRAS